MDFKIVFSSEDSLLVQFEQKICPEVNNQVRIFSAIFRELTNDIPEIYEVVPAYCSATVYFDHQNVNRSIIKTLAETALNETVKEVSQFNAPDIKNEDSRKKIINIPVCYEGDDFAPDLKDVAANANISTEEVIKIHSGTDYLIYMLGFLPGFPYLGGLDERLVTPRLETPRTKIPAGSVAIGGSQTGLYPQDSPGGWRIIGRTPLKVFDSSRTPACYYEAGDLIRFVPVSRDEFDSFDESLWKKENNLDYKDSSLHTNRRFVCGGGIEIIDGGICSTIQDYGRKGFERFGINGGGAMDVPAMEKANKICRNSPDSPCIEALINGPVIKFTTAVDFAITGAMCSPKLNGVQIECEKLISGKSGDVLECGFAQNGLRIYIAFAGGILQPSQFGSASSNKKLKKSDQLAIGYSSAKKNGYQSAFEDVNSPLKQSISQILELLCIPGSQFDFFEKTVVNAFTDNIYTVSKDSNRMGIRFEGESLCCGKTDIISDAIPFGAVQITSRGLPVVMAADRQTTGGYAKIATVTKKSMYKLAQAVPGTKVRFKFISL